jgi:hypothetical protein
MPKAGIDRGMIILPFADAPIRPDAVGRQAGAERPGGGRRRRARVRRRRHGRVEQFAHDLRVHRRAGADLGARSIGSRPAKSRRRTSGSAARESRLSRGVGSAAQSVSSLSRIRSE